MIVTGAMELEAQEQESMGKTCQPFDRSGSSMLTDGGASWQFWVMGTILLTRNYATRRLRYSDNISMEFLAIWVMSHRSVLAGVEKPVTCHPKSGVLTRFDMGYKSHDTVFGFSFSSVVASEEHDSEHGKMCDSHLKIDITNSH